MKLIKIILNYLQFEPLSDLGVIRSGVRSSTVPETQILPMNLGVTKAIASEYYNRNGFFDPVLYDKVMAAKLNH
jgi:hypothetical protein